MSASGQGVQAMLEYIKDVADWLALTLVGLVTWIFKRQVNRIDELEKSRVSKQDFDKFTEDQKKDFNRIHQRLDTLFEKQGIKTNSSGNGGDSNPERRHLQ